MVTQRTNWSDILLILLVVAIGYIVYTEFVNRPVSVGGFDKEKVLTKMNEVQHQLDSVILSNKELDNRITNENKIIMMELQAINKNIVNINELGNYEKKKLLGAEDIDNAIFYLEYIKEYRSSNRGENN